MTNCLRTYIHTYILSFALPQSLGDDSLDFVLSKDIHTYIHYTSRTEVGTENMYPKKNFIFTHELNKTQNSLSDSLTGIFMGNTGNTFTWETFQIPSPWGT